MTNPDEADNQARHGNEQSVAARARAGLDQARTTAGQALDATRRRGEAVIEDTREKSMRAAAETNRLFLEHPIAAVAAAAAAGAVLGIFLPRIAIASRAGKLAGRAVKAAVATDAAQIMLSGLASQRKVVTRKAAGKAAAAVGKRIRRPRKPRAAGEAPHPAGED